MSQILSPLKTRLSKKFIAGILIALAITFPAAVVMAESPITISAKTGVANFTEGDTSYASSVNASYDQVVKVNVSYDNTEAPSSGLVANNVSIKINIPSTPGATQTVTTTTGGNNTNTVSGQAVVNLAQASGYLQYVPGSGQAAITETNGSVEQVTVPDSVVLSAQGYEVNNGNPCQGAAFAIEARVMVPGVSIVKQVEESNQTGAWATTNTANPGDTLKYMITYKNIGNTVENNVIIGDNLPPNMKLVNGTTMIYNTDFPNGTPDSSNNVATGGINVGNYNPGATAFVVFEVTVPQASQMTCGVNVFRNVGVAQPQGLTAYYNTATTNVTDQCNTPATTTPTPTPTPTTPAPTQLANTGPGNVIGVFSVTTIVGAVAHRLFKRHLARS